MINDHSDHQLTLNSSGKFYHYVRNCVDTFLKEADCGPDFNVRLFFYPTQAQYQSETHQSPSTPIFTENRDSCLRLHLCQEALSDIAPLALQGWLDLELMTAAQEHHQKLYAFNFKKQILPLFYVSGSAVNIIRHLVAHLEAALKKYLATGKLIDLGHGMAQLQYYFLRINPSLQEKQHYLHLIDHSWMRALFLCKKHQDFMAVAVLSRRGVSSELRTYWWRCHNYVLAQDRALMEKMTEICHLRTEESYGHILVEMFKKVKSHLLTASKPGR